VHGREVRAAQSLDVMTSTAWRGRGLYLRLATQVYDRLAEDGTEVVYGFPNEEASPGFFGPLGWVPLGPVPLLARPLPTGLVGGMRVHGRAACMVELDEAPDEIDALWARIAPVLSVTVPRDREFLQWRLFERPGADYVVLGMRERGRLVGVGAVGLGERQGRRVAHLLDLLVDPGDDRAGRRLLRELLRVAARRRAHAMLAWCPTSAPIRPLLRLNGFTPVPAALLPIRVNVGVRVFDRRRRQLLTCLDPSAWYLSYLDSDTV
jgi:GNAT superfamily N-acetyltransferase